MTTTTFAKGDSEQESCLVEIKVAKGVIKKIKRNYGKKSKKRIHPHFKGIINKHWIEKIKKRQKIRNILAG